MGAGGLSPPWPPHFNHWEGLLPLHKNPTPLSAFGLSVPPPMKIPGHALV